MIDFQNKAFIKLRQADNQTYAVMLTPLLTDGEGIISSYVSVRDGVVFTNKRIISINVQGLTGAKKDFTSMPYSKIQVFSVESAGTFDIDSELELYFSSLGKVKFEFSKSCNITEICNIIGRYVL